jgi:hypothetical protein
MSGEFAGLVEDGNITKVVIGIEAAVLQSFETDQARTSPLLLRQVSITHDEVKRRGRICTQLFRELRGDLKWGVDRILDHLPSFLRKELDGIPWQPEARRASWVEPAAPPTE